MYTDGLVQEVFSSFYCASFSSQNIGGFGITTGCRSCFWDGVCFLCTMPVLPPILRCCLTAFTFVNLAFSRWRWLRVYCFLFTVFLKLVPASFTARWTAVKVILPEDACAVGTPATAARFRLRPVNGGSTMAVHGHIATGIAAPRQIVIPDVCAMALGTMRAHAACGLNFGVMRPRTKATPIFSVALIMASVTVPVPFR